MKKNPRWDEQLRESLSKKLATRSVEDGIARYMMFVDQGDITNIISVIKDEIGKYDDEVANNLSLKFSFDRAITAEEVIDILLTNRQLALKKRRIKK